MNELEYHHYLLGRSLVSKWYRNMILYPTIAKELEGKVLDVGCGIGDFLTYRKNTIGADINSYNLAYCRNMGLEVCDIKNEVYPFEDNSFNGAILDNVLEHLSNPQVTLSEVSRVLNLGATLIIGVPGSKGYKLDSDHKVFYDENNLDLLAARFGFKNRKWIYAPLMIKSNWLDQHLSQYCLYGVFKKE